MIANPKGMMASIRKTVGHIVNNPQQKQLLLAFEASRYNVVPQNFRYCSYALTPTVLALQYPLLQFLRSGFVVWPKTSIPFSSVCLCNFKC